MEGLSPVDLRLKSPVELQRNYFIDKLSDDTLQHKVSLLVLRRENIILWAVKMT